VNKRHIRAFFVPEQNCDLRSAITDKPKLIITEMSYRPETDRRRKNQPKIQRNTHRNNYNDLLTSTLN